MPIKLKSAQANTLFNEKDQGSLINGGDGAKAAEKVGSEDAGAETSPTTERVS